MVKTIHTLYFCFLVVLLQAQDAIPTYPIDLIAVLEKAGGDNLQNRVLQQQFQLAIDEQNASKSWWLPDIYGGFRLHQLNGVAMNSDGRFFLDVNRQNFWGGAGLSLDLDLANGIFQNQTAKAKTEAKKYEVDNAKNELKLRAVQLYFELQAEQFNLAALEELSVQSEQIIEQLEVQEAAGLAYRSDLLLARSNFQHHKIASMKSQRNLVAISVQLKNVLSIREEGLLIAQEEIAPVDLVQNTESLQQRVESHPAYQMSDLKRVALEKEQHIYGKGLGLPQIRLGVSNGAFGDIFSATDINNQDIDPLYNTFDITGSILWRIPLENVFGFSQKDVLASKITLQNINTQLLKDEISCAVEVARSAILTSEEQLNFARFSIDLAKEALDQCMERQTLRTAQAYEVFHAQEVFLQARLDYIEAVKVYNQAQYAFYVALGNELK